MPYSRTTPQAGTVAQPTSNPPSISANISGGSKQLTGLKGKQKRFITILQDDFQFDIIEQIVKHMKQIDRAKKIKPLDKARLLQNYYLTLLSYCIPKMKILEDDRSKTGDKIQFNISVGGSNPQANPSQKGGTPAASASGVHITIPTVKQPDGSFSVDN